MVSPYFLDPIRDIAALGPVEAEEIFEEKEKYMACLECVRPVSNFTGEIELRIEIPVHIYNRNRWISGGATAFNPWGMIAIRPNESLE